MRYCVSGRQPYSILKKADEVRVAYADRDRILDFVERVPDKVVILDVPGDECDWNTWGMYSEKFSEFHIALHKLSRWQEFAAHGIKWYWPYPITSFYELNMIVALKPSYIMVGPPLSFDLDRVFQQTYISNTVNQIPVRMTANVARPAYLPAADGYEALTGQWVRPEDAAIYSTRVQCFEFENVDLKQEEVLLHVYKENQNWPGNLNLLIQELNFNVDNRAIPEELGERRMNCGQRCCSGSSCHLCESALKFAEQLRKEKARRSKESVIDNK